MDLWVVAAATGAAYTAKYWRNLSGENDGSLESHSWSLSYRQSKFQNLLQQIDQTGPFRRLAQRQSEFDGDVSDGKFQQKDWIGRDSVARVASTSSGNEDLGNVGKFWDHNVLQFVSSPQEFNEREHFQVNVDEFSARNELFVNSGDGLFEFANGKFIRSKPLRSRRPCGFSIKPLESSLTAQVYREHAKMEEYVFSSLPSPSTPTVRPLLVTDGSLVISRASGDSFGVHFEGEDELKRESRVLRGSYRQAGSVELPRKLKHRRRRLNGSGVPLDSQGSSNGLLLFIMGTSIGILSAVVAHKREMDKLSELLKQSEGLVQDLHEELEMKDMLTVKDLEKEDNQSHKIIDSHDPVVHSSKWEADESTRQEQQSDSPEKMSEIEAELEAELERLELNMKVSSLERISDFLELDPDFEADVVKGDLKLDMINRQASDPSDTDTDASGTSTNHTDISNYAVPPQELRLRLHEVIESRLEARIKELEAALQDSLNKVHSLESQRINWPLVNNLSKEALEAYNEAHDEMTETNNDTPDPISDANNTEKEMVPFKKNLFEGRNNGDNDECTSSNDGTAERWSRRLVRDMISIWEDGSSRTRGSDEVDEDGDTQCVGKTRYVLL